jgi:hypothetical protein
MAGRHLGTRENSISFRSVGGVGFGGRDEVASPGFGPIDLKIDMWAWEEVTYKEK